MNPRLQERTPELDGLEHADLSQEEWQRIEPLLPAREPHGTRGRPCRDHRTVLDGVLWVLRTGAAWRDLPPRYGPWQTAYMWFRRWRCEGLLQEILERLELVLPDRHRWDGDLGDGPVARDCDTDDDEATKA